MSKINSTEIDGKVSCYNAGPPFLRCKRAGRGVGVAGSDRLSLHLHILRFLGLRARCRRLPTVAFGLVV